MSNGSVSQWLASAKDGDADALSQLHQRYWPELVRRAQSRLGAAPRGADGEDVAQAAFFAFHEALQRRGYPDLLNRHQLLALLSHIVACKAVNEIERQTAQKRGNPVGVGESLQWLVTDQQHTPLQQAILRDCYDHYLASLPESLQSIAELHLAGLSNREMAERLNCVERTVERKLALLRECLRKLAADSIDRELQDLI